MKKALILPPQMTIRTNELKEFFENINSIRYYFEKASSILEIDLHKKFFSDNEKEINESYIGRCGIICITCGLMDDLKLNLEDYTYVSGPSLGSITAGYITGVYSFEDMLNMVKIMVECEKEIFPGYKHGNFWFYNISQEKIMKLITEKKDNDNYVAPCMFTADNQMILTGEIEGLEIISKQVLKEGGLGVHIPYSPPAHSSIMQEVRDLFKKRFIDNAVFNNPLVPNICNNTASELYYGFEIKKSLTDQYLMPVIWTEILQKFYQEEIYSIDILGPGKFLKKSMEYTDIPFSINSFLELKDFNKD